MSEMVQPAWAVEGARTRIALQPGNGGRNGVVVPRLLGANSVLHRVEGVQGRANSAVDGGAQRILGIEGVRLDVGQLGVGLEWGRGEWLVAACCS